MSPHRDRPIQPGPQPGIPVPPATPEVVLPAPIPMSYLVTAAPGAAAGQAGVVLEIFSAAGHFVTFLDAHGAKALAAQIEDKAAEAQSGLTVIRRDPRGPQIRKR